MHLPSKTVFEFQQGFLQQTISERRKEQSGRECNQQGQWVGMFRGDPMGQVRVEVMEKVVVDVEPIADDPERTKRLTAETSLKKAARVNTFERIRAAAKTSITVNPNTPSS